MTAIAQLRADAEALDADDPLGRLRAQFDLPPDIIYLDGNSLGPPTKAALTRLERTARSEWKTDLITSWNKAGWIDLPERCGAKIANLIGAAPQDVIVTDSVSVNIFKLASALLTNRGGALACPEDEFPTDGYILQGLSALTGAPLVRLETDTPDAIKESVKVVVKSLVHYKTAAVADMTAWESAAEKNGAVIIWDLSHAAGVLDLDLKKAGARYAVGCGYKFLNGGPGAPAYVYVDAAAADGLRQPLSGWMGHSTPFAFSGEYTPAEGVRRFACGTPPILSLSALDAALDVFDGVSMKDVEAKAAALGDLFLDRRRRPRLETISPLSGVRRGGHISLRHSYAYEIVQAMIARGVIGDFRAPDIMRFGFSPLYTRFTDIWDAAVILEDILENESWRDPAYAVRQTVT